MSLNLEAVAAAVVPSGKLLWWVIATGATLFMAGVGATLQFGSAAENIEAIPVMQENIASHQTALEQLLDSVAVASDSREQILCVVVVAVSGRVLTAPEVLIECP